MVGARVAATFGKIKGQTGLSLSVLNWELSLLDMCAAAVTAAASACVSEH